MRKLRTDTNHKEIAQAFEKLGWHVHHTIGSWDLTVQKHQRTRLIEVKKDAKAKHTKAQEKMLADGWIIDRVECIADVIAINRQWGMK